MSELDAIKAALVGLERNLEATDEHARHAGSGVTAQAAHLAVVEAILAEMLRRQPIDLAPVRAKIDQGPEYLRATAHSVLAALAGANKA